MRALVYFVATSIDGYIAGPDGQVDAFPMTGDHFDVLVGEFPETLPAHTHAHFGITDVTKGRFGTILMGRRTYEPALAAGIESPYPHLEQWVFSRSLRPSSSSPSLTITDRDPLATVRELKQSPGKDIWLCGGGELAGILFPEIDETIVKINPLLLGRGIPMIAGSYEPAAFELVSSRAFSSGVVIHHGRRRR